MKILIFVETFGSVTTTFIYNEITRILERHEVLVICMDRGDEKKYPLSDLKIIPFPTGKIRTKINGYLKRQNIALNYSNKVFAESIQKPVDEFQPDIIHGHFGNEALRFFENLSQKQKKIPSIISFHGYDASKMLKVSPLYARALKEFYEETDRYAIYCSDYLERNLIQAGVPLKQDNSSLLHYGIKVEHFKRSLRRREGFFTFLQISSFQKTKGHEYTIKAFHRLLIENPDIKAKLIFGGDGPYKEDMIDLCLKLEMENHVEFKGWITPSQVKDLMEKADAFVHHSVTTPEGDQEGMPNAIIEAMAMELPVIATYHSGIPELVEDGRNGYLVDERDVETYTQRMAAIMDWEYVEANRRKIEEHFNIELHTKKLDNIYTSILKVGKTGLNRVESKELAG